MEKIVALPRKITILGKDWGNKGLGSTNLKHELKEENYMNYRLIARIKEVE